MRKNGLCLYKLEDLSSLNQLSLPGMLGDVVNYHWLNIVKLQVQI